MIHLQSCPKEICRECLAGFIQDRIEQKHIFYLKDEIINTYNVLIHEDKKSAGLIRSIVEYYYRVNEFIQYNLNYIDTLFEIFVHHKNISPYYAENFLVRDCTIELSQLAQRLYNFIDKRISFHYLVLDYLHTKGIIMQEFFDILMTKIKDIHNLAKKCVVCKKRSDGGGNLCRKCLIDLSAKFHKDLETISKINPTEIKKEIVILQNIS